MLSPDFDDCRWPAILPPNSEVARYTTHYGRSWQEAKRSERTCRKRSCDTIKQVTHLPFGLREIGNGLRKITALQFAPNKPASILERDKPGRSNPAEWIKY